MSERKAPEDGNMVWTPETQAMIDRLASGAVRNPVVERMVATAKVEGRPHYSPTVMQALARMFWEGKAKLPPPHSFVAYLQERRAEAALAAAAKQAPKSARAGQARDSRTARAEGRG